jgi:hypothetical protein
MDLTSQLANEIKQLVGFSSSTPRRVEVTDSAQRVLAVKFVAVDTMSCAFESLTLHVPELVANELSVVKDWANALSQRVTYLLESISPIEIDERGNQILIRSTPPDRTGNTTQFYEVLLSAEANGTFLLRRFRTETGQTSRHSVDIRMTHETLNKLIVDLLDTVPQVDP